MSVVSAIIPTRNEAAWLPRVIEALQQSGCVDEIIVADFESTDGTAEIARGLGCKVVPGGKPGVGRNNGARVATGDVFVFADADVVPDKDILTTAFGQFDAGFIGVYFRFAPITDQWMPKLVYRLIDLYSGGAAKYLKQAQGLGSLMVVKRSAFEQVGGFDETIKAAEDADFLRRIRKIGRVKYQRDPPVPVSARRFHLENGVGYFLKVVLWGLLRVLCLKTSIVDYRWGRYDDSLAQHEARLLEREKQNVREATA